MNSEIEKRKKYLLQTAASDAQYKAYYEEFLKTERDFFDLLLELTETQQDRLWRFVNLSNDVDDRLVEIILESFAV